MAVVRTMFIEKGIRVREYYKPNYVISNYGYYVLLRHPERSFKDHSKVTHKASKTPKIYPIGIFPSISQNRFVDTGNSGLVSYTPEPISIEGGHFSYVSIDPTSKEINEPLALNAFERLMMDLHKVSYSIELDKVISADDRRLEASKIFPPIELAEI
jgi:hypothetical protein